MNTSGVLSVVADGVARDRDALGLVDEATYSANTKRVRRVAVEGLPPFPVYLYASTKALDDPVLRAYLDHLLANGARIAAQAGLGALPAADYEEARKRLTAAR